MEVKTPGAVPLWFSKILDDLAIYPASFSKYGFAIRSKIRKHQKKKLSYHSQISGKPYQKQHSVS